MGRRRVIVRTPQNLYPKFRDTCTRFVDAAREIQELPQELEELEGFHSSKMKRRSSGPFEERDNKPDN